MRLLILGGTRFVGRHLVAAATVHGHDVTLFNRGHSSAAAHPSVESIQGDRNRDLHTLAGRRWDAVIDTCGYLPRNVKASAEAFAAMAGQYVFISSVSAYADLSRPEIDERAPLATLTSAQLEQANAIDASGPVSAASYGPLYGGLKALCEEAAEKAMPGRVLTLRPGLIVGPHDYTDRFTYWVARAGRGGEVLAPEPPERSVQFIDALDLAAWTIEMVERRQSGVFNVSGEPSPLTTLLETCRTVTGSDASFTWVSERFLLDEQVGPWTELPLWLPKETMPHLQGLMAIRCQKAADAGLRSRALHETVRDVWQWYRQERAGTTLRAGLAIERERQLLQAWRR